MADRFDLTPVDHDPFEAMGAIPGLMPKPNALQAAPTSLQGNPAGLGLPAGVLAKYAGEQVDNAYSMATLPGDVALGRTDPNSPEGFGRTMGLAMGLAGGPLAGKGGGARMGFGGAAVPAKTVADMSHAEFEKFMYDTLGVDPPQKISPTIDPTATNYGALTQAALEKQITDTGALLAKKHGVNADDAQLAATLAHNAKFEDKPLNISDYKDDFQPVLKAAFDHVGEKYVTDEMLGKAPAQKPSIAPPKPLDHSYWGNEVLSAIHDGLPPDQAVAHVKDRAPDSSHAAIDAAAKEYVPHAVELMKQFSADEVMGLSQGIPWAKAYPELSAALPGVKKFLGIEEPKPSHSLTPVEHDPFYGTVLPVDMNALYGGLSMDPAARMERARELGFNPDLTLFHGRGSGPFQGLEFKDPSLKSERAIFATDDPAIAETYAGLPMGTQRPEVMPMLARMQNPKVIDWGMRDYHPEHMRNALEAARAQGHDSAIIQGIMDQGSGSPQTQYAIFDPKNLRSKFAAFNPAYRDSANLLSTRGGPFALTPVEHDPWEQR